MPLPGFEHCAPCSDAVQNIAAANSDGVPIRLSGLFASNPAGTATASGFLAPMRVLVLLVSVLPTLVLMKLLVRVWVLVLAQQQLPGQQLLYMIAIHAATETVAVDVVVAALV